ncbi:MAG: DNA-3-methyladenine glycosylase [Azospirillum brasilense]|nr:MAG: DNA-3-methyladenine glycosylase [Azospirillum brasilense]
MAPRNAKPNYPHYWAEATAALSAQCPIMRGLITQYKGEGLTGRGDSFYTLMRSIAGQQISVKAADAIWARLEAAVVPLTPKNVLATPDEILRNVGLSMQKINYLKNIAAYYDAHGVSEQYWAERSDAEVMAELTSIKGIGVWTAEMFMIFHLHRPDIFPVGDIGVLKAMDRYFHPDAKTRKKPAAYQKLATRWAPYRTVATWYLWRALDPVPVAY